LDVQLKISSLNYFSSLKRVKIQNRYRHIMPIKGSRRGASNEQESASWQRRSVGCMGHCSQNTSDLPHLGVSGSSDLIKLPVHTHISSTPGNWSLIRGTVTDTAWFVGIQVPGKSMPPPEVFLKKLGVGTLTALFLDLMLTT
jgi:hypothetical protein